ncbi:hypothetical protein JR049_33300, partial [Pseudomonas aeruginosa]|uniref:hypothetical protein n=1 Tax=Pseudomonas aeruginosa TaxID=287 RepID=UPI001BDD12B9
LKSKTVFQFRLRVSVVMFGVITMAIASILIGLSLSSARVIVALRALSITVKRGAVMNRHRLTLAAIKQDSPHHSL